MKMDPTKHIIMSQN